MYHMPLPYQQYNNAYPQINYQQPPGAANGYGWHGNGYGWQLDPSAWHPAPAEPTAKDEVVEVISAQKVGKQDAAYYSGPPSPHARSGEEQDYYKLRDYHLSNGTLFEDPDFPPTDSSLFFSKRPDRNYQWKRPHEIVDDPRMFVEGYSRFDVQQGELGDCWLLAAAANLTLYKRLFFQIVPDDQEFDENYAGIFHFRFWQYGKWVEVVIDDRLPTYHGELIFLHSTESNEFWSALLEKAYAKLHGSYEALKGGSTCEAMEDFTGGVTEMYELDSSPPNLFQIIHKAYERSSLMASSIEPDPYVLEARTRDGLIRGHAYSVTKVKYVDISTPNVTGKIPLLRLRNPWGNESEWNGPWSDGSPEWEYIADHVKEELGLTFDNDGEFWISYKDFQANFNRLEICNLNPDSLSEEEIEEGHKKKWEMSNFDGQWVRGMSAGGCRNFIDTFWRNPQYRITLTDPDDNDEDGKCTMIVALMQKNRRQQRLYGVDLLTIGFAIYHLPYPERVPNALDLSFFRYNASVARSPSFINLREVSCRFKLPPGTYCIIPSTFDPDEEGEFLLRVFTEKQTRVEYFGSNSNSGGDPYGHSNQTSWSPSPFYSHNQNFSSFAAPYTTQAAPPYPTNSHPPYPANPAPYPTNDAPYPSNPAPYPTNPSPYPMQPTYPPTPQSPYENPQYPYPPQDYGAPPNYPQPGYPQAESPSRDGPVTSFFKQFFNNKK